MKLKKLRCLTACLSFVGTSLCSPLAYPDTHQPSVKLGPFVESVQVGPQMDVSGRRLWGTEFVGQDLRGADFSDCALGGVVLRQCDLTGASFQRAVMTGLVLDDCQFADVDVTDAVINGIRSGSTVQSPVWTLEQITSTWSYKTKDLSECTLKFADSGQDHLVELDFASFRLANTRFAHGDLSTSSFSGAKVYSPRFHLCRLRLARLAEAEVLDLNESQFHSVEFADEAKFERTSLASSEIYGTYPAISLNDASIAGLGAGPWVDAKALSATKSYKRGTLTGLRLVNCDLRGIDFSGQVLTYSSFTGCNFSAANFDDAVISGVAFSNDTVGLSADQVRATWNYKHGRMQEVMLPDNLTQEIRMTEERASEFPAD